MYASVAFQVYEFRSHALLDCSRSGDVQASPMSAYRNDWKYLRVCILTSVNRFILIDVVGTVPGAQIPILITAHKVIQAMNQLACVQSGHVTIRTSRLEGG